MNNTITIVFTVIGAIGAIASLMGLLLYIYELKISGRKISVRRRVSWRSIKKGLEKLEPYVRKFKPDVIIGISGGGIVVGALIAVNWRFFPFYALDITSAQDEKGGRKIIIGENTIGDLTGKKVLLVDNELYTGQTMKEAMKFLDMHKHPEEIKTLVIFKLSAPTVYNPDYCAYLIKRKIIIPWSYKEEFEKIYYERPWS